MENPRRHRQAPPHLRRSLATLALAFSLYAIPLGAGETETANGPTYQGISVQIDLPDADLQPNSGGTDGAGLCVFASLQMAARWGGIDELADLFSWMKSQRGGGWPEKVDRVLTARAPRLKEAGGWINYEGSDPTILDAALRTNRPVCVTYGYGELYANKTIGHMVLLVHLDANLAAIRDNNDVNHTTWMSRAEFLKRWKHPSGKGWCVILITPPPPPVPSN